MTVNVVKGKVASGKSVIYTNTNPIVINSQDVYNTDAYNIEMQETSQKNRPSNLNVGDDASFTPPTLERTFSKAELREFKAPKWMKDISWFNMYEEIDYAVATEKSVDDRTMAIGVAKSLLYTFLFLFIYLIVFCYYAVQKNEFITTVNNPSYIQYNQLIQAHNLSVACTCSESLSQHKKIMTMNYKKRPFCDKLKTRININEETVNPVTTCSNVTYEDILASAPTDPDAPTTVCGVSTSESSCVANWIGDGYCDETNNIAACKYDGGDCCSSTCGKKCTGDDAVSQSYPCGYYGYNCMDPSGFRRLTDLGGETDNIEIDANIDNKIRKTPTKQEKELVARIQKIKGLAPQKILSNAMKEQYHPVLSTNNVEERRKLYNSDYPTPAPTMYSSMYYDDYYYNGGNDDSYYSSNDDFAPEQCTASTCVSYYIGDGFCDSVNNCEACLYDGGDCCPDTCNPNADLPCGINNYQCCDYDSTYCGLDCPAASGFQRSQCKDGAYTQEQIYKIKNPEFTFCTEALEDQILYHTVFSMEKFTLVPPAIYSGLTELCSLAENYAVNAETNLNASFLISKDLLPEHIMKGYSENLEAGVIKSIQSSVAGSLKALKTSQDLDMSQSTWGEEKAFYNMWEILENRTGKSCVLDFNQKVTFNYSDYYFNETLFYTYGDAEFGTAWKTENKSVLEFYANKSALYFDSAFSSTQMFCIYYSYYYGNYSAIDTIVTLCTSTFDVECSYFQTVLNHPLEFFNVDSSFGIKTVDELYSLSGGIQDASVEPSFEAYYNLCQPSSCQYTEIRGNNGVEIIVTLLSLYGGLTQFLGMLIDYTIGYYYAPTPIKPLTSTFVHSPRA